MDQKFSELRESDKSMKPELGSIYLYIAGAVVASWSLTQEVASSNPING